MANNQLTPNDEELIDLAYSTTYRSSIRKMMDEADTSQCRESLQGILDDPEMEWED